MPENGLEYHVTISTENYDHASALLGAIEDAVEEESLDVTHVEVTASLPRPAAGEGDDR